MLSGDAGDDDGDLDELPEPFADDQALTAVRNLWAVLRSTQVRPAASPGRLLAPDGRYEHVPLVAVQVAAADLEVLGQTALAQFCAPCCPRALRYWPVAWAAMR